MTLADLKKTVAGLERRRHHYLNEALTRAIYLRVVQSGDTVIDLGANRGGHTAPLAARVGLRGIVHAVEPNPQHWAELLSIGENVRLWPIAAGDELSVAQLDIPLGLHGWASLCDRRHLLPGREFVQRSVMQAKLDDIAEIGARPIRFIKCDVENREMEALSGARALLMRDRPVIVLESGTANLPALFDSLDYIVLDLFGGLFDRATRTVPNCVALPREREDAAEAFLLPLVELERLVDKAATCNLEAPTP